MTGELFQLALQGVRRRRKTSLLLFLVLCFSFSFAVISLSVTSSMEATNQNFRLETYGRWEGAIADGAEEDEAFLRGQSWFAELGISRQVGKLLGEKGSVNFGTMDEGFLDLGNLGLQDGHWPEADNEIAMEANALSALGYDYELGQQLTLTVSLPAMGAPGDQLTVEHTFTLCGVVRCYTSLWSFSGLAGAAAHLNSAVVTEGTAALLQEEGGAQAEIMEEQAQQALDEMKAAGEEADPSLERQLDILLAPYEELCYIFTPKEAMGAEMEEAVKGYLSGEKNRLPFVGNAGAFGSQQEEERSFQYFYAILIFAVMVFAILCIYALQLPKQVRQIALFRSIGIKKRQLRKLAMFENLILCLPALILGAGLGALGTLGALRLLIYSGSAPIEISLPWALLGILAAAWVLGVFLARLIILQIALREPLIGRIAMSNKKAKRMKYAQNALISVLVSLLCGVAVFTAMEALEPLRAIRVTAESFSYQIMKQTSYELIDDMMTPEWVALTETVPGVRTSEANIYFAAELRFEGMENSDYYQTMREVRDAENKSIDLSINFRCLSQEALAVHVRAMDEDRLGKLFDFEKLGIDPEAFDRGEEVIVLLETDTDGSYLAHMPIVESAYQMAYSAERVHPKDPVLKTGDTISLNLFGRRIGTAEEGRYGTLDDELTSLYESSPKAVVLAENWYEGALSSYYYDPYDVICSYSFLEKALSGAEPGYTTGWYHTGSEFGYGDLYLYTDRDAGYLATDAVIASMCADKGCHLSNNREANAAFIQGKMQTLILLFSGGGCAALVLLLILANTLSLEREREKRAYGVMQALGMSKKQTRRKIGKTAVLRGVFGAVIGWALFGAFLLYDAARILENEAAWAEQYGAQAVITTYGAALEEAVHRLQIAGADLLLVLGLTFAGVLVIVCLSLLSKRQLFKDDLMEKLRGEE